MAAPSMIRTARLLLRPPVPADAEPLADLMTPAISRFLGSWPVPLTGAMVLARIETSTANAAAGSARPWVMEADGAPVGWIRVDRHHALLHRAVIGYWLGEAHQGHGLMREALEMVVADAFGSLALEAVEAMAHVDNTRSQTLLRRMGMREIGPVTRYAAARDRHEPCLLFELLAADARVSQAISSGPALF